MSEKLTVAVLFGGKSNEHSISIASASGVLGAIDRKKYRVIPIGITQDGEFVPVEKDPASFTLDSGLTKIENSAKRYRFAMDGSRELRVEDGNSIEKLGKVDVVFPLLHGRYGEDGTIQGLLELIGVRYVGNRVFASAAAMDKQFSKALFRQAGLITPSYEVVSADNLTNDPESALERIRKLSLPVFVKPVRAGSSVGISKVKSWDELGGALAEAFEHDDRVIIEQAVIGREIECAVLDSRSGEPLRVSSAGEIKVFGREFYDFAAKYTDPAAAELICPADLSEGESNELARQARIAFRALGCEGLARVDFFLTKDGFVINEINTMPGFTSISMYPRAWAESGIGFSELIDELIELA